MKDERGVVMIITVIIIMAVISIIVIQTALTSLSLINISQVNSRGQEVKNQSESCLQEALVQIHRDDTYSGGLFTLGTGTCNVIVSGVDNNRSIQVLGSRENFSYPLNIEITLTPFAIIEWDN